MRRLLLYLTLLFSLHACSKIEVPLEDFGQDEFGAVKEFFKKDSTAYYAGNRPNYNFRQSLQRVILWERAYRQNNKVFVPVRLRLPEGMTTDESEGWLPHRVVLATYKDSVTGDYNYEMITLLSDSLSSTRSFTGTVLLEDFFKGDVKVAKYAHNERVLETQHPAAGGMTTTSSGSDCAWVKVGSVCVGDINNGGAPDICGDRFELQCNPIDQESTIDDYFGGNGEGGGSTGGGNDGNNAGDPNPMDKTDDDCDATTKANKLLAKQAVIDLISRIKGKNVEWGAYLISNNPNMPNSFAVGTEFEGEGNRINISPRWDQTNGYHMGFIHNHPSGSAPSPSDVYNAAHSLNQMYNNPSVSNIQLTNYIDNFASIVVSNGYIYTITIKHARNFSYMKDGFNRDKENEMYKESFREYLNKNPNVTVQEAGEYALLKLYDNEIQLNKQKIGETNKNQNIKLDNNKKVKTNKPC